MRRFHLSLAAPCLVAVALTALSALPAAARECATPGPAPTIPDGTTATTEQMTATRAAVQEYVNMLQDRQDCLEANIKRAPKDTKSEVLQKMRDDGNAGIDQAKALSTAYAAQVKIFKARAPK